MIKKISLINDLEYDIQHHYSINGIAFANPFCDTETGSFGIHIGATLSILEKEVIQNIYSHLNDISRKEKLNFTSLTKKGITVYSKDSNVKSLALISPKRENWLIPSGFYKLMDLAENLESRVSSLKSRKYKQHIKENKFPSPNEVLEQYSKSSHSLLELPELSKFFTLDGIPGIGLDLTDLLSNLNNEEHQFILEYIEHSIFTDKRLRKKPEINPKYISSTKSSQENMFLFYRGQSISQREIHYLSCLEEEILLEVCSLSPKSNKFINSTKEKMFKNSE
jgi:hypothetical protein